MCHFLPQSLRNFPWQTLSFVTLMISFDLIYFNLLVENTDPEKVVGSGVFGSYDGFELSQLPTESFQRMLRIKRQADLRSMFSGSETMTYSEMVRRLIAHMKAAKDGKFQNI